MWILKPGTFLFVCFSDRMIVQCLCVIIIRGRGGEGVENGKGEVWNILTERLDECWKERQEKEKCYWGRVKLPPPCVMLKY